MRAAVLADAGVEALGQLFPRWRIWADSESGWHASRRGEFIQHYHDGAPAFYVHAPSAGELAGQLRWQEAAETQAQSGLLPAAAGSRRLLTPGRARSGQTGPEGR